MTSSLKGTGGRKFATLAVVKEVVTWNLERNRERTWYRWSELEPQLKMCDCQDEVELYVLTSP